MKLSLWAWLLWTLPIFLVAEVVAFLIIGEFLGKTAGELIGPFFAYAVPWTIFAPLVWWLRILEVQGTSPKRLALGWVLSTALFLSAIMIATFYSGVELGLMDPKYVLGAFIGSVLCSVPSLYFIAYRRTLAVISTRAAGKSDGASSK